MATHVQRHHRTHSHFTQISNDFLRDGRIPLSAFRIACFLLSHEDTFNVPQERLAAALGMSTNTVAKAMRDLEGLGYLIRVEQRTDKGYRTGTQLHISDVGFTLEEVESLSSKSAHRLRAAQGPSKSASALSAPADLEGHKKTNSNKKITNEEEGTSSSADALDPEPALFEDPSPQKRKDPKAQAHVALEAFGEFWLTWPRKVGKTAAERAFVKAFLLKDAPTAEKLQAAALALAARYAKAAPDRRQFMPHAATWLNRHGWHEAAEDTFPDLGSTGSGVSDLQKNGSDWHALGGADPKEVDWVARRESLIEKPMVEAPQPPPGWKPPVPGRLGFP